MPAAPMRAEKMCAVDFLERSGLLGAINGVKEMRLAAGAKRFLANRSM
jgi:hypothetical protein